MNNFSNLPTSWQIKTLGEVCVSTNSNITFKNIQDKKGDCPIYGASGVVAYVDFYTKENQSLGIVKDGAGIGRVFLLPPKASVIGTLHYVENNDDLNLKYLFYFLQSINLARYITGSAIPHIYFRDWKKEQIPLPPLEIQKRIVARLESAFEKIKKGSAHLQDAKAKLTKYKQSLLKSAFDGTLTATASLRGVEKAETIHTAPSLRANEASVANQNNDTTKAIDCHSPNGLRNDSTHSSLQESAADEAIHKVDCHESANADSRNDNESVDCHDLTSSKLAMTDKENPKLPQGWTIKTLGEVCELCNGYAFKSSSFINKGVPVIRIGDIKNFEIDISNAMQVQISQDYENYQIQNGDLLIAMSGATTGKMGIYKLQNPAYLNQRVGNLKIKSNEIIPEYRNFALYALQTEIYKRAYGGAQPNISKGAIESLKIPLPPLETQKQIVKLLEKHLQHADKTGEFIESALNKAKQLKQSLLKSAFLGELV